MVAPFQPDPEKIAAIREALPATGAGIYLNTGTAGPIPVETARVMRDTEERELRVGRGSIPDLLDFLDRTSETRAVIAALLGADLDSIALTGSTTQGVNIAAWSIDWRPGDRALTTRLEHPGLLGPLVAIRERFGVSLDVVDIGEGGDDERTLAALEAAITPQTRLVALSHVSWATGALLPVAAIGELVRRRATDAWYAIDAAQSAGAIALDPGGLGADFVCLSGHKWLLGPEGTGALWASERARSSAGQSFTGYTSFELESLGGPSDGWQMSTTARRFETQMFHRPSILGLGRGVGWLEMYVGLEWAFQRASALASRLAGALRTVDGVTVVTPFQRMATLVSFRIAGWTAEQVDEELSRRVFAIVRTIPGLDAVRASVGFFNTEEELDRFAAAVGELARHTPESLPRRPSLVIVNQAVR